MRKVSAPAIGRVTDVRPLGVIERAGVFDELLHRSAEGLLAMGRTRQRVEGAPGLRRLRDGRRRLFDNHMGVDAAEAEGADAAPARPFAALPGDGFANDLEREARPIKMAGGGFEMQMGREFFVLQRQHQFDQSSDARARFEVADVGFDGTDQQWAPGRTRRGVDIGQGF